MFFKQRIHLTDIPVEAVHFYIANYIEVMRHSNDKVDVKMKEYLFEIIKKMGVPKDLLLLEELPERHALQQEEDSNLPEIIRRLNYEKPTPKSRK